MSIFDVLTMIGGLCLFLFGMDLMGQSLERRAGGKMRTLLDRMTGRVFTGFLTGLAITAVIQSSSATTVMVVGFVNSGLMTLRQAINVIMGANVGTTVTAWLLSLGGISGDSIWVRLLKPTSFTPVLALVGIIFFMFCKDNKKKDTGTVLLGFATLMFGMETMSSAVGGLADVPAFRQLFITFQNPALGLLAGAVLNLILNYLFILHWGPWGVTPASFLSLMLVFLLRAYSTRGLLEIDFHPAWLVLNLALVLGEIWCMMNLERWALPVVGITAVVCVMNIREVLSMLDTLLAKFVKKKK